MLYMIVYDIKEDKIRDKVRKILKDLGGTWIQYSAFLIELEIPELQKIMRKLTQLIAKTEGDIRFIPLCKKDRQRTIHLKNRRQPKETVETVV
ncbi:MAG: CRISPR-associated endonuclease Cas2 [Candidatus Baldrarchaeia archaeon]